MTKWILLLLLIAVPVVDIRPVIDTDSQPGDTDDPSIWIHPTDKTRSLIIGTIKEPAPDGGLAVFSLNGKLLERVVDIDRPNNVDVQGDICVVSERLKRQLRVYRLSDRQPHLTLLGTIPVFTNEPGEAGAPMGIALYERPRDKALFAFVSRKTGPSGSYVWQYRLYVRDAVSGEKVRAFGEFSETGEIEAIAVDDARGLVYYSDEDCCIRVYKADPAATDAAREIARFAETGYRGNREGIAIADNRIIVADQLIEGSEYHVYDRASYRELAVWKSTAESTDGIEATPSRLGSLFPAGMLVVMNNSRRNFQLYRLPR